MQDLQQTQTNSKAQLSFKLECVSLKQRNVLYVTETDTHGSRWALPSGKACWPIGHIDSVQENPDEWTAPVTTGQIAGLTPIITHSQFFLSQAKETEYVFYAKDLFPVSRGFE